ncbi:MAG: alpha/beta hydrolase [Clostridia bacterium]|nr:alpha/beta hydrolase [Clostridia bacterium]
MKKIINRTQDGRVNMEVYVNESSAKLLPAIISLPGGAFTHLSDTDKEPTAMTFYRCGFQTFVLNYSVGKYSEYPAPLDDISWAILQIRKHSIEWRVNPDKIIVMGFSAGASVAGMSATQWNITGLSERVGAADAKEIRPDAAVIAYGACNTSETIVKNPNIERPGSWGKIVTDLTPELDWLNYVDKTTPPMFIWQPAYDKYVPKENQIMLANALKENGVKYELHMFKDGYHGMSVGYNAPGYTLTDSPHPDADRWVNLCIDWLNRVL